MLWQVNRRVEALEAAGAPPDILVVGAGYAGVELAASLADRFGGAARIKIVTAGPQHALPSSAVPCVTAQARVAPQCCLILCAAAPHRILSLVLPIPHALVRPTAAC